MSAGPQVALLARPGTDVPRLHLQHGPIDLVIDAAGPRDEVDAAYRRAAARFDTVLEELVAELPDLRKEVDDGTRPFRHTVAQRMLRACRPYHREEALSSMIAVAGSVADEIIEHMDVSALDSCFVNNGGDIAVYTAPGQALEIGLVNNPHAAIVSESVTVGHRSEPVRIGLATSGWGGRSFSRGIADAVTVIAASAAAADVAATLVANAVTVEHPGIRREPAGALQADSDLGDTLVTTHCPRLPDADIDEALRRGMCRAQRYRSTGLVTGAVLWVQKHRRAVLPEPTEAPNLVLTSTGRPPCPDRSSL